MPGTLKKEKLTTAPGSDLRQLEIQHNHLTRDVMRTGLAHSTDLVWAWQSAAANSGQALGRGSTDTAVATGKFTFATNGFPELKAAVTTGTALTAQTVPASKWALYALDIVTGGTISVAPAALNTTGYATEALAIAALPARITAKARLGYITVLASASTWIGATDALAGGSTGNPATTTNYYPYDGIFAPTGQSVGPDGSTVTAADNASPSYLSAWTGGRNGVLIASTFAIGSTDTRFATTAFVYSANGVTNINKAAVTAGTAFGALGTIPADKWGIIVGLIDSLGTITYLSGPANYAGGYASEAAAIGDLSHIYPTATASGGLCRFGYVTIKTKAATAFIVGTDALAGGASGNVASATNYYPTPSVVFDSTVQGETASLIAQQTGAVILNATY